MQQRRPFPSLANSVFSNSMRSSSLATLPIACRTLLQAAAPREAALSRLPAAVPLSGDRGGGSLTADRRRMLARIAAREWRSFGEGVLRGAGDRVLLAKVSAFRDPLLP